MLTSKKLDAFMVFALMVAITYMVLPNLAYCGTAITIDSILCNITRQISGNIGKAIAILIVISVALGLFVGKITWGVAIAIAVGMGVLFGAESIVKLISGSDAAICAT